MESFVHKMYGFDLALQNAFQQLLTAMDDETYSDEELLEVLEDLTNGDDFMSLDRFTARVKNFTDSVIAARSGDGARNFRTSKQQGAAPTDFASILDPLDVPIQQPGVICAQLTASSPDAGTQIFKQEFDAGEQNAYLHETVEFLFSQDLVSRPDTISRALRIVEQSPAICGQYKIDRGHLQAFRQQVVNCKTEQERIDALKLTANRELFEQLTFVINDIVVKSNCDILTFAGMLLQQYQEKDGGEDELPEGLPAGFYGVFEQEEDQGGMLTVLDSLIPTYHQCIFYNKEFPHTHDARHYACKHYAVGCKENTCPLCKGSSTFTDVKFE